MSKRKLPTKEEYLRLKDQAYKNYKKIKPVKCSYLNMNVVFNSDGFRHIIYRSRGKKRHMNTQLLRFQLIDKAVRLIGTSNTLQEYESIKTEVITEDHHIDVTKIKEIEYFGFIGIVEGWKIKVIIKKEGNGNPIFWSVIPNWVTSKKRDNNFKRYLNHSGNLKED